MMTSTQIRQKFLDFFRAKDHEIVPSAPIVVKDDPTLLFTNAGMNPFKDYFLGNRKAPHSRVADTQKCLRVSGKHNDLEEVGVDTYHHTMFEMLGNWSFGDPAHPERGYFKKEAIAWSWELLTEIYMIPKDRLYVTVFEGDPAENLPKDTEAFNEWQNWISEDRIVLGNKKDNFWEMGETGPCGPCTEIHVDCRSEEERRQSAGKQLVNRDHPQVIEIWNNVFIQFNRLKDGSLESLPARHVDTGMGLERLVRVLQGKQSNYDTDIFTGTIAVIGKETGKSYGNTDSRQDIAFRVLSDHIRAIGFTIADGQLPSNTGAGYVIRRILRRAVRYYYSYLDHKAPLLHRLLPVLAAQFSEVFPELSRQLEFVSKVVKEEEDAFLRTLGNGIKIFDSYIDAERSLPREGQDGDIADADEENNRDGRIISGRFAFKLNDTYGFPVDLTNLMAKEAGWTLDREGFEQEMQQQKSRSRAAGLLQTDDWIVLDESGRPEFVGYDNDQAQTKILKYRKVSLKGKEGYQYVLLATPFYAESGGQVGDTGELIFAGETIPILDTKKENQLTIHFSDRLASHPEEHLLAKIDVNKRRATAIHHSATHLLHAALRKVLGPHVTQKGSLVNEEHLRFDFSHFARVTEEELSAIEEQVNEKIRQNVPVMIRELPKDEAMQMGAMALFGEKYGHLVRVVVIDPAYSIELCGGTHAGSTGELGYFVVRQETAVAAGVRRIEALSGRAAERFVNEQRAQLHRIKESLRNPKDVVKGVVTMLEENASLKKKLEAQEARQLTALRDQLAAKTESVNGSYFLGALVDVQHADALKKLCLELKNTATPLLVVLAGVIEGKAYVAVALDEALVTAKGLDAARIIKEQVAPLIRGGGGGQKTLATAGGQDGSRLQEVVGNIRELL